MESKMCSVCGLDKPLSEYRYTRTFINTFCNDCKREKDRQYLRRKGIPERKPKEKYSSTKVYFKICPETGKLFTSRYSFTVYSKEGAYVRSLKMGKERSLILNGLKKGRIRTCIICNNEYDLYSEGSHRLQCSDICRDIYMNKKRKKAKRLYRKKYGINDRQRARHYGVMYEPINKEQIFNKYQWKCAMCGIHTPKHLINENKDNSPELDHIIPLSKKGNHIYNNVQLLCRRCNREKGNRLIGQLTLQMPDPVRTKFLASII
jgi:5-methylcytosine-specific restriction endonuclease McrA